MLLVPLDFLLGPPQTQLGMDNIYVVVDALSIVVDLVLYNHFRCMIQSQFIYHEVVNPHGVPKSIASHHDSKFVPFGLQTTMMIGY